MQVREILPTTGAITVGRDGANIVIDQQGIGFSSDQVVTIPACVIVHFLYGVFSLLDIDALRDVAECCREAQALREFRPEDGSAGQNESSITPWANGLDLRQGEH